MTIAEKLIRQKKDFDEVYEAGKKAEYDRFWDTFQDYGNREEYSSAFAYTAWDDTNFKPKYDIKVVGSGANMFRATKIVDLESTLQRAGVVLDTSKATSLNLAFSSRTLEIIPPIDMSSIANPTNANISIQPEMRVIRKLICAESTPHSATTFRYATGLVNLIVEGVIGREGFDVQWSTKLSHDSITSIINALYTATSGLSVTLSKKAVDTAFETGEGANDGSTSAEWLNLIATRPNWTISLV